MTDLEDSPGRPELHLVGQVPVLRSSHAVLVWSCRPLEEGLGRLKSAVAEERDPNRQPEASDGAHRPKTLAPRLGLLSGS